MRGSVVYPDTTNPPIWHVVSNTNDPVAPGLASGVIDYQDSNTNVAAWGRARFCKEGWWTVVKGAVSGTGGTLFGNDTLLWTFPLGPIWLPPYAIGAGGPGGSNEMLSGGTVTGFGVVGSAIIPVSLSMFADSGWLRYFAPATLPTGANTVLLSARWLTGFYGE
jgi:hypothetical protein